MQPTHPTGGSGKLFGSALLVGHEAEVAREVQLDEVAAGVQHLQAEGHQVLNVRQVLKGGTEGGRIGGLPGGQAMECRAGMQTDANRGTHPKGLKKRESAGEPKNMNKG